MRIVITQSARIYYNHIRAALIIPMNVSFYSKDIHLQKVLREELSEISYSEFIFDTVENKQNQGMWRFLDSNFSELLYDYTSKTEGIYLSAEFVVNRLESEILLFRSQVLKKYFISDHKYCVHNFCIQELEEGPPVLTDDDCPYDEISLTMENPVNILFND